MIGPHFPASLAAMCGHVTELQAKDVDRSDASQFYAWPLKTSLNGPLVLRVLCSILWMGADASTASEQKEEPLDRKHGS